VTERAQNCEDELVEITFWGAARGVTGSQHLIHVNSQQLLLDCGLFQGHRAEAFDRNRNLPFDPHGIDAAILSHAHIDHCGNIPTLVKGGFRGDIHCTMATSDLTSIMLRDSAHINSKDVEYVNKKHRRKGLPPVEPLYTIEEAEHSLDYLVAHKYNRWFPVTRGVQALLRDAGHILGSAITVLEIDDHGRRIRLGFTGDLGRKDLPILRDPVLIEDLDYLITESTYGNRFHEDINQVEEELAETVTETYSRGGKLIIPAFAVERTQEVIYTLHRLRNAGRIPPLPVYADSPLAIDATEIFRLHPECFDEETNEFLLRERDPFGFRGLHYMRNVDESKSLNEMKGPMIIISASGMCEAGRILHHLKNNVEDPRNTVLIVSFQAEHTLGRRIAERRETVRIFGDDYRLRARVAIIDAFSAHADREELLWWIGHAQPKLKAVFVVHGEEEESLALAEGIEDLGVPEVLVPHRGDRIAL
jgi:metallo-beta-lactamase family protein